MLIDSPPYVFRVATSEEEFEQIHRLNYETFVEEFPQYPANPTRQLVDRFHDQNIYFVALRGEDVIGTLALRAQRPFLLEQEIPNLDAQLPHVLSMCELRLLAVRKRYRGTRVFLGIMNLVGRYTAVHDFDMAIISPSPAQLKLYRHLGFMPFGPAADDGCRPMYLTRLGKRRARQNAVLGMRAT